MLDGGMLIWFVLTGVSLLLLVIDLVGNSPVSWVQKLAWFLVVCYTGPIGLIAYLYACRRPFKGGHDAATKAWWKQGINSEVHCLAGDATGIIIAASIVPAFAITNGWDIVIEYAAGFICGLFIFQALMMIKMFNGNYFMAVRKTFFAEAVSMNFVMAGMIPTMVLLAAVWPESMEPTAWVFWFRMSLASIAGGILAFPINAWLVHKKLKHGCMTLPGADGAAAPKMGHAATEPTMDMSHAGHDMSKMDNDMPKMDHDMAGMDHDMPKMDHDMSKMDPDMAGMDHGNHEMGSISFAAQCVWVVLTFALVVAATYITHFFTPVTF